MLPTLTVLMSLGTIPIALFRPWIGLVSIAVAGVGIPVCAPAVISLAGRLT